MADTDVKTIAEWNPLVAPFTPEQVVALNDYQRARRFHPFTCGNNRGTHPFYDGDKGVLVATVRGWICMFCDYTQDWAHPFMALSGSGKTTQETGE